MTPTTFIIIWFVCGIIGTVWNGYQDAQKSGILRLEQIGYWLISSLIGPVALIAAAVNAVNWDYILWKRKDPPPTP